MNVIIQSHYFIMQIHLQIKQNICKKNYKMFRVYVLNSLLESLKHDVFYVLILSSFINVANISIFFSMSGAKTKSLRQPNR